MDVACTADASSVPGASPAGDPHPGMIRIGPRVVRVDTVRTYRVQATRHSNRDVSLATLAVAGLAAVLLVVGVVDYGWRLRFLIAAGIFALLAFAALHEFFKSQPTLTYYIEVDLTDGQMLRSIMVDAAEAMRVDTVLHRSGARRLN